MADQKKKLEHARVKSLEDDQKLDSMKNEIGCLQRIQASHDNKLESLNKALEAKSKEIENLKAAQAETNQRALADSKQWLRAEIENELNAEWAAKGRANFQGCQGTSH